MCAIVCSRMGDGRKLPLPLGACLGVERVAEGEAEVVDSLEPVDAHDVRAGSVGALEEHGGVVLLARVMAQPPGTDRLGPAAEEVQVAGEVHAVGQASAG